MDPYKSSAMTSQARKRLSQFQLSTEFQPPLSAPKPMQTTVERDTLEEAGQKDDGAQAVHRTTQKTELRVLDDPSARDFWSSLSAGSMLVKDVPYNWILSCPVTLALCEEALDRP